jgi:hypothetical protein
MRARKKGVTPTRMLAILKRQAEPRWGSDYIPSILATPQEAPSISHACTLNSSKLGREVHCLSLPEMAVALLALYDPDVVDLQEQRMLAPWPTPHPLFGFPGLHQVHLPPIRGMIDVADRMGYLSMLPRVKIENPDTPGSLDTQIFPYIGDLLLFRRRPGNDGLYCVNWSIKDQEMAFRVTTVRQTGKQKPSRDSLLNILPRHEMEEAYYRDAGIRTVRIAGEQVDAHVVANLKQLFLNHGTQLPIGQDQQRRILKKFMIATDLGIPPLEVAQDLCARGDVNPHACRTVLYQAIWRRELRVDLFRPVLFNQPLRPEQRDVLDVYANWFKEG